MSDKILQCPHCQNPAVRTYMEEYECLNPDCMAVFEYDPACVYDRGAGKGSSHGAGDFCSGGTASGFDPGYSRASASHFHPDAYECAKCTLFFSRKDDPSKVCPGCGAEMCPECHADWPWCRMCDIKYGSGRSDSGYAGAAGSYDAYDTASAATSSSYTMSSLGTSSMSVGSSGTSKSSSSSGKSDFGVFEIIVILLACAAIIGVIALVSHGVGEFLAYMSTGISGFKWIVFFLVIALIISIIAG